MRRILPFSLLLILIMAGPAAAQQLNLDLGDGGGSTTTRIVQIVMLLTVLSIAPSILIMVTSFTRIVVVLSFLRQAMGTQSSPPNMVMVSLALFLTGFVMMPTFEASYNEGIRPLIAEEIDEAEAFERAVKPLRAFMLTQVRDQDLRLFLNLSRSEGVDRAEDAPLKALIPAFMISELRRAFEIGFLIYLPFLVIDMVVASVLMSMGMMMLPPISIALPFKLIFFVLVDGWYLVCGTLVQSFAAG
ncbi:MAG: flagellar type III secretion system pore protein FliP [Rhodospirillaceae bacterium]|nr:flagellar type III secretion system pore protein FliP [Rhodospirillaceae bacterium]